MKQQITQIALWLIFMFSIASSGKQCPPKSIKPVTFPPKSINGIYGVMYCNSPILCAGLRCDEFTLQNIPRKEKEFSCFTSAFNTSSGKMVETDGILKITGPGQYTVYNVLDVPYGKYYALALKPNFLIEYGCIPNKKGEIQEASWIHARNNAKLSDEDMTQIKEILKLNELNWNKYKQADNKDCKKVDQMRSPAHRYNKGNQ